MESASNATVPSVAKADMFTADYVDEYVAQLEAGGVIEPSTVRDYLKTARRIRQHFADIKLRDLDPFDIQTWEADLRRGGLSASVVGKAHRLLKSACKRAVELDILDRNPLDKVKPPRCEKKRPNALDRDGRAKVMELLSAMKPTSFVTAATISPYTGIRRGELCALRWRDIDLDNSMTYVQAAIGVGNNGTFEKATKTSSSTRSIPISQHLAQALKRRMALMQSERMKCGMPATEPEFAALYVLGSPDGQYLSPNVLTRD